MKIVVGGSGRIEARLVTMLARDDHEVVAASRRSGVDAVTGEGLAGALSGASVVVGDHVVLSVVGTERLVQSGYFRAKSAQEKLIKDSSVPYTIVRCTQFFEFLGTIADAATHGNAVRVPPARIQPIAADHVARAVARIAIRPPLNGTVEIGGPEPFYLDGVIQRVLGARNDPRDVILDPHARHFGAKLNERSLVPGDEAELGEIRFDEWLGRTAAPISDQRRQLAIGAARIEGPPLNPLSEGAINGSTVTCPLHGAQFNVWTGAVLCGPAKDPLKTYAVTIDGDVGRVDVPLAQAVQGA